MRLLSGERYPRRVFGTSSRNLFEKLINLTSTDKVRGTKAI